MDGESKFNEYYMKIEHVFVGFLAKKLPSDAVRPVAQECFTAIYFNYLSKDPKMEYSRFRGLLFGVAENLIKKYYRTNKKSGALYNVEDNDEQIENVIDASINILESIADKDELAFYINQLPDRQKKFIVLKYIEDKPYKEISKITGLNEGTLRALNFRVLKKLGKIIEKNFERA